MDQNIERFKKGAKYVSIASAVTRDHLTSCEHISDDYSNLKCVKFIPASGAATRMFEDLYKYVEDKIDTESINTFFDELEDITFYEEIKDFIKKEKIDKSKTSGRLKIIDYILNTLNYGNLPKAVIKMNSYEGYSTTPIEEHIYEGERYLCPSSLNFHFTISNNHEDLFNRYIESVLNGRDDIKVSYSFQKPKTDTLAVDMDNNPFMMENGELLYRPGGHGALIENLNDIDGDIIFIKNIDNVCHRDYIEDTVNSKKKLASIGYAFKEKIDGYIRDLLSDDYDIDEIKKFINQELNITFKGEMTKDKALSFLNRPLRVCGVVKNQGEPGGGPFLVDNGEYTDLQICEKSEIDLNDKEQHELFSASEFFNPVDIVCFVKDHRGEKFNLLEYVNEERYFISQKTYKGKDIKALEHPGLWNGAMDNWNTLFVEVPLSTFNPVKKVNDLLRPCRRSVAEMEEVYWAEVAASNE
ncbi:DUF4301 family protein [Isachenkonia alkalipeptolytica]|uniref:DUF4301 family protein n=1 Tax=Isachenkonia alkalipeptolytica TaxID=2565777 RepID=A0AA43XMN4_9CLOT|nr:DUF4301 family protein [Isachenkonia alkalipeptolytica]NBG89522.1 DUF4301 family protein [Isachenkonia alkalipeptolytica]